jgi:hypothetical protein
MAAGVFLTMLSSPGWSLAGEEAWPRSTADVAATERPAQHHTSVITTPFQSMGRGPGSSAPAGSERRTTRLRVVGHLVACLRFAVAGPARC